MGEIADGLINGDFDFYTGEYLGRGDGFPRSKKGRIEFRNRGRRFRQNNFTGKQKKQGVEFWLYDKGVKNAEIAHGIIREYVFYNDWQVPNKRFIQNACVKIQQNFPAFTKWYNENKDRV